MFCWFVVWHPSQIQAAFRTDEIRRTPPTPQDEMRAGMSYFHETIWKGVPKFLRRIDTALKNIGINERLPYNAPLIQFSSWMGGDRDGNFLFSYATVYISVCLKNIILHWRLKSFCTKNSLNSSKRFQTLVPCVTESCWYWLLRFLFALKTLQFEIFWVEPFCCFADQL